MRTAERPVFRAGRRRERQRRRPGGGGPGGIPARGCWAGRRRVAAGASSEARCAGCVQLEDLAGWQRDSGCVARGCLRQCRSTLCVSTDARGGVVVTSLPCSCPGLRLSLDPTYIPCCAQPERTCHANGMSRNSPRTTFHVFPIHSQQLPFLPSNAQQAMRTIETWPDINIILTCNYDMPCDDQRPTILYDTWVTQRPSNATC